METTMTESRCWYTEKVWGALSDGFSVQDTLAGCVWLWQNGLMFVVVVLVLVVISSFTSWRDGPDAMRVERTGTFAQAPWGGLR